LGSITASQIPTPHYDAIVIGAGFAGLYMLHKLRNEQGLNVRAMLLLGEAVSSFPR
jgi:cation diffusion facilitator CzcD-associated flavoprotein CzcO